MAEQQPMTEAAYYILLSLLHPGHGYGMMQRLGGLSGGGLAMAPGTPYGVLSRWRGEGPITLAEEDGRRKTYAITDQGRDALRREYERLRHMVEDGKIMEEAEK